MFGFGKSKEPQGPLAETRNWYSDRFETVVVQRNMLLLVTVLALLGVAAAMLFAWQVTSSKTFEPYVIQVEERTGITTLVNEQSVQKFSQEESVKRFFVWRYVLARETYDLTDYEYNYSQVVRLFSSQGVYSEFYNFIRTSNPESPVNLGRTYTRKVKLKSISFLDKAKTQAQVRIVIEIMKGAAVDQTLHRIVTMSFGFYPLALNGDERLINPLGFQVIGYRVDEDSPS